MSASARSSGITGGRERSVGSRLQSGSVKAGSVSTATGNSGTLGTEATANAVSPSGIASSTIGAGRAVGNSAAVILSVGSSRAGGALAMAVLIDSLRTTSTDLKPTKRVTAPMTVMPTTPTKPAPMIRDGLRMISTGPFLVRNRNLVSWSSQCRLRTTMGRFGLSLRSIGGVKRLNSCFRIVVIA